MQTSNSNVDSPPISASIGELQQPSDTSSGGSSLRIPRLPAEILSEIFLHSLSDDLSFSPTQRRAPLIFTRICRQWREVAIGLPWLWTQLRLIADDDLRERAYAYDLWLKRSRGCPLSLKLECCTDLSEARSLLQPYIQQISSLELTFWYCRDPFMMEDFHGLKELIVRKYADDSKLAIERTISKLPVNLRKMDILDLPWICCKQLDFVADSGWAHLTHLEISIYRLDAFPRILRLCPNLSSVTILGIFHPIENQEPVTHTNLQCLYMCPSLCSNWDRELGLFKVLTLPNLRVLQAADMGSWPQEEFQAFLTRSKCSLECLAFRGVSLTDQQREAYAALVPCFEIMKY
ncbi:uncharacterized protein F5891DRAFT_747077 [Suillus fuscotomentosus]|uniref:F-box domain-containing protein n=1 Tax=Suillus fuscotomentosus TaxID=1912939 RepID=A0AAD4EE07_9AGAM|nr:uncharacterized protein F5891DRAFT_747077 [Suillus fuscotomentosus]KAG1904523.1 hypothetical protein F5891DRAFT_747077 [Suillus fuscotomentosus]